MEFLLNFLQEYVGQILVKIIIVMDQEQINKALKMH